jgi:hypothetical protein
MHGRTVRRTLLGGGQAAAQSGGQGAGAADRKACWSCCTNRSPYAPLQVRPARHPHQIQSRSSCSIEARPGAAAPATCIYHSPGTPPRRSSLPWYAASSSSAVPRRAAELCTLQPVSRCYDPQVVLPAPAYAPERATPPTPCRDAVHPRQANAKAARDDPVSDTSECRVPATTNDPSQRTRCHAGAECSPSHG